MTEKTTGMLELTEQEILVLAHILDEELALMNSDNRLEENYWTLVGSIQAKLLTIAVEIMKNGVKLRHFSGSGIITMTPL